MKQLIQETKSLANSLESEASYMKYQMEKLETVQGAVAKLMKRVEEMKRNGWHNDKGMAQLSFDEIQETLCLIDMAFCPLANEMNEAVGKLSNDSEQLLNLMVGINREKPMR